MKLVLSTLFVFAVTLSLLTISIYAQESDYTIPSWIKVIAGAWSDDQLTDSEYQEAMKFLIEQNIIVVDSDNVVSSQEQEWEKKYNESESKRVAESQKDMNIHAELYAKLESQAEAKIASNDARNEKYLANRDIQYDQMVIEKDIQYDQKVTELTEILERLQVEIKNLQK